MIVPEDGTGLANANSYASAAVADDYFEARNVTAWADATDEAREAALLYSTRWLDGRYDFPGSIVNFSPAQALAWPRAYAYDDEGRLLEGVPALVVEAQLQAALAHVEGVGLDNAADQGRVVKRKRVEGAVEIEYEGGAASSAGGRVSFIDNLLAGIASSGGGYVRLVRA